MNFQVNGRKRRLKTYVWRTLLEILREDLHLTGTKHGCETGECGACTVILNGKNVYSCLVLAPQLAGTKITTIEGMPAKHPLIEAFVGSAAIQCGYCTPGMIMAAKSYLDETDAGKQTKAREIKHALSGNLCRCASYSKIASAVQAACRRKQKNR